MAPTVDTGQLQDNEKPAESTRINIETKSSAERQSTNEQLRDVLETNAPPISLDLAPELQTKLSAIGANLTPQRQQEILEQLKKDDISTEDRERLSAFLRPVYPNTGVNEHLNSHHALVDRLLASKKIDADTAKTLRIFIERHDQGYREDATELLTNKADRFTEIFGLLGATLGMSAEIGKEKAKELHAFLLKHKSNYLVSKVLGHGVVGLALNVMWLEEQGIAPAQAMGLSQLFAAHHPGFPIGRLVADRYANWKGLLQDKVDANGTVIEKGISPELRQLLLIDDDPSLVAKTDDEKELSADALRKKLIAGAVQNGIPEDTAITIAGLGYALDRIVPSNELEIYKKKYPLIIGNIIGDKTEKSLANIYGTALKVLTAEAQAAIATTKNIGAPKEVQTMVEDFARSQIAACEARQETALNFAKSLDGFGGTFESMNDDIKLVQTVLDALKIMKETGTPKFAACETLLKTLKACQGPVSVDLGKVAEGANPAIKDLATLYRSSGIDAELKEVLSAILNESIRSPKDNFLQRKIVTNDSEPIDLITEGSIGNTVYILLQGSVEFSNGKKSSVIQAPSILGEISAIYGRPASGNVRVPASGSAELLEMSAESFRALQTTSNTFSTAIGAYALKRVLS